MKIYLAGPMRNLPQFNFPAFIKAAEYLRSLGHEIFSPAEHDMKMHGKDFHKENKTGDHEQAIQNFGFSLRRALGADLDWICREAEGIALLPGWENSKGANAEKATAEALGLEILFLKVDTEGSYHFHREKIPA